jgi:hypothetical protein
MSSLASANPVTLGYWRIRGLAAHIRMLFEFLDVPFVDGAERPSFHAPNGLRSSTRCH